jgi:hypothetical protein
MLEKNEDETGCNVPSIFVARTHYLVGPLAKPKIIQTAITAATAIRASLLPTIRAE